MSKKDHLEKIHKHMSYYNRMSPFPIYDTDYVKEVEKLASMTTEEYDNEPVVACTVCNNLHITIEEVEDGEPVDVCNRCFSVGEIQEFKNIYEYNEYLKKYEEPEN